MIITPAGFYVYNIIKIIKFDRKEETMRTAWAIIFIFVLFLNAAAQEKMSEREFDGFRGDVKSVSIEVLPVSGTGVKKRSVWEKWTYNFAGMKMSEHNPAGKSKTVFRFVDEYKIAESVAEDVGNSKTFTRKFTYEYDADGRIKTERIYFNPDKPAIVRTFKYDPEGRRVESVEDSPTAVIKKIFIYDSKGNLIEETQEQKGKGEFVTDSRSRTVYSDYKLDAQGNWTERRSTSFYESNGEPYISLNYQVITYF